MRRSLLCVTVMLLAALLAFCSVRTLKSDEAVGQEPPATAETARTITAEAPAVASAAEIPILLDFVKQLRQGRPESEEERAAYDQKFASAIRKACLRIVELDRNEASAARRFACQELLKFEVEDLAHEERVPDEVRQRISEETLRIIKNSDRGFADVEFAITIATAFEEFALANEAKQLYQALGDLFARSPGEQVAQRRAFLTGAAHRLAIVGKPFELTGQSTQGETIDLASLRGKVVLVEFWATWCGHCQEELPNLTRNYQKYHDRGFEIVGVNVDDDRGDLDAFLTKQPLPWTILHDDHAGSEHPATIQYGITAYPTSFLLDRKGRVVAMDLRGRGLSRKLAELMGTTTEKPTYPVFNISEVIDTMTAEGARLHKQGKTRGDAELRKQMNRKTVELVLPEPEEEPISERDLYRRASESVFIICSLYRIKATEEWETSLATAFAVTSDGVLTTSCHVFDNEDEADVVVVMDVHRRVFPVKELLAVNKRSDTCLFRVDATDLKPIPLADDGTPGTNVRVLGHPGDSFYFMSSGLLANYERDHDGIVWLNTTADFGQGSSGGPVLDECGNVVGQVSRTYTLYAGGTARGRPRRVTNEPTEKPGQAPLDQADDDLADPQMVFKACVPVKTLRALVKQKSAEQ